MSAIRTMFLLYGRNMRQLPRIPTVLVFGIVMPIIQLLLFGTLFESMGDNPQFAFLNPGLEDQGGYRAFITPFIIFLTTFLGMANASAAFIVDLRTGYFDKLRTTPARPAQVIFARLFAEMTRVTLQALLILAIALALGAHIKTGILGGIFIVLFSVVFSMLTVGLMVTALAMKTKSDQATQSTFPLFFVLLFLTSAYVPPSLIKVDWLRWVVEHNPLTFLVDSIRTLMIGTCQGCTPYTPGAQPTGTLVATWPWADIGIAALGAVAAAGIFGYLNYRVYRGLVK